MILFPYEWSLFKVDPLVVGTDDIWPEYSKSQHGGFDLLLGTFFSRGTKVIGWLGSFIRCFFVLVCDSSSTLGGKKCDCSGF